jgi:hypothetical protein
VLYVIPVALIHHWLLLHWPSVAGPGVGVIGILLAIVAHRRAARAVAECTALINGGSARPAHGRTGRQPRGDGPDPPVDARGIAA